MNSSLSKVLLSLTLTSPLCAEPVQLSGIYPHLAMFNSHAECGTGAIVPFGEKLWVMTYAPHWPKGSDDKLYSISKDLTQTIHPESLGGTPANRMIHRESNQLFMGPYAISAEGSVRAIPYEKMPGRHTGNARHLFDPEGKIYFATMEEGLYEVDVETLEPTELFADDQQQVADQSKSRSSEERRLSLLPGYHGKGLYSGQGVVTYSNNGEPTRAAKKEPTIPSGVLAEWDGKSDEWTIIRRNQFTDITGPGGIHGNPNPATDPIWAIGWDDKSLLLGVRTPEEGWSFYRLPKGSHSYDGAHGWNTEWPRIRDIGERDLLMTMHGTFWKFPKDFSPTNSRGISPRSNYLKVIGDFCRWGDRLVMGCDDTAKSEFLNKRKAKGHIAGPQSQSNLWFIAPETLDNLGPAIGRGCVWKNEDIAAGTISDPFLASGYNLHTLQLKTDNEETAKVRLEFDKKGTGQWRILKSLEFKKTDFFSMSNPELAWIRLVAETNLKNVTAAFTCRNKDDRSSENDPIFADLATKDDSLTGGIVRARDKDKRTLAFAAVDSNGEDLGYYELDEKLALKRIDDAASHRFTKKNAAIASGPLTVDEASLIYTDDDGNRWRLPKSNLDEHPLGNHRIAREVATERDFFNAGGTFYELPARNAGGFTKVRPVATHNLAIHDFCSYRGLLILSGIKEDTQSNNPHLIRSDDGKTALWAGAIDDTWKLGKPRGKGGPWKETPVKAGAPSDPYLMTAYDEKHLTLSASIPCTITAQVDLTGDGNWVNYQTFQISENIDHTFPKAFSAYWIRFVSNEDTKASAILEYK
ncbi:MAG: hypothetical protein ACSHYB_02630 [Roseibacillus sp.]